MSLNEFLYQSYQAYDFYYLNKYHNISIQIGGSDQWGNIDSGINYIQKRRQDNHKIYGLTINLLTDIHGNKIGKTSNTEKIWLDSSLTSSYQFYQYFYNINDDEILKYLLFFCPNISINKIYDIYNEHIKNPKLRLAQDTLANEITLHIHDQHGLSSAKRISNVLYNKKASFKSLHVSDIISMTTGQITMKEIDFNHLDNHQNIKIIDLCHLITNISKSQIRRLIEQGGIYINNQSIKDKYYMINVHKDFIHDDQQGVLWLRIGKKQQYIAKIKKNR